MIYIETDAHDEAQLKRSAPSYFDSDKWSTLCSYGFETSKSRLIHSAILLFRDSDIHRTYKERLNHCVKLFRLCRERNNALIFLNGSSRDRGDFGEALGVAIGAEAIYQSSSIVKPSNLRIISQTNKSLPDYSIRIRGKVTTKFETKGLQNGSKKVAIKLCSTQLASSASPKYAFISRIKYNGSTRCKLFIADPDVEMNECSEKDAIVTALMHYAKCMKWAGFYQFAEALVARAMDIQNSDQFEIYNKVSLDNQLVSKLGITYELFIGGIQRTYRTHIPRNMQDYTEEGIFYNQKGFKVGFLVDKNLLEILVNQDFDEILNFDSEEFTNSEGNTTINLMRDGTLMYINIDLEESIQYFFDLYSKLNLKGRDYIVDRLLDNRQPSTLLIDYKDVYSYYENQLYRYGDIEQLEEVITKVENLIEKII